MLASRRTTEYDAGARGGGWGRMLALTEEDGVRHWCQGGLGQRRTLAPRTRRRMEENADTKGGGEQRRTLALRRRADMDADVKENNGV